MIKPGQFNDYPEDEHKNLISQCMIIYGEDCTVSDFAEFMEFMERKHPVQFVMESKMNREIGE